MRGPIGVSFHGSMPVRAFTIRSRETGHASAAYICLMGSTIAGTGDIIR